MDDRQRRYRNTEKGRAALRRACRKYYEKTKEARRDEKNRKAREYYKLNKEKIKQRREELRNG